MKNQYFGDVNDYMNYGLLQLLMKGCRNDPAICWMLTRPDGRADGNRTGYLREPGRWRRYAPQLYDSLAECVATPENRSVDWAASRCLFGNALLYDRVLDSSLAQRKAYFRDFMQLSTGRDLIFFDPDNGLEVASIPCGRHGSEKYLYWPEVIAAFHSGSSVLIFQHFCRENHGAFTRRLAQQISQRNQVELVISFRTAHVVFFLAPQSRHLTRYLECSREIERTWRGAIQVEYHCDSNRMQEGNEPWAN